MVDLEGLTNREKLKVLSEEDREAVWKTRKEARKQINKNAFLAIEIINNEVNPKKIKDDPDLLDLTFSESLLVLSAKALKPLLYIVIPLNYFRSFYQIKYSEESGGYILKRK